MGGTPGALRRLDRHVLAGQRQVRRLRPGLRLLRPVALRRVRDAAARDDGARADPRARPRRRGGRRAPLLHGHPGPGAVQARLREGARRRAPRRRAHEPQALRVGRPHVGRARQGAAARPASSACTTTSRRPSPTTTRSRRPCATSRGCGRSTRSARRAWRRASAGSSTSASREEQRVEMAFELAAIDPTSVPINLLNPRPGTKFGDRDYMDPWEVVKWIAIFRLVLPDALFRLCGGRVENLGDLQPMAVKAGLNGVMMGNFLTTLGNTPAQDREMFTELGLNVARQPDNGSQPRPDNRSGWLDGETPDVVGELHRHARRCARGGHRDPPVGPGDAASLRAAGATFLPRPDGAPNRWPRGGGRRATPMSDVAQRLAEIEELGLTRRMRLVSGPQGPRVVLDGKPVLLLCSNNYLGLADHPRVREAAADAAMRWGVGAGRVAARVGDDDGPPPARAGAVRVRAARRVPAVRLRLPGQHRRLSGARRPRGRRSSPTSSTTRRSSTAAGWRARRSRSTATATLTIWRGRSAAPTRSAAG